MFLLGSVPSRFKGLKDWCLSSYYLALKATPSAHSLNFL
ncbi:hypothetical protein HPHPH43_1004 [Helicobacter pylori Hp H-43]|nr:hypothetical protein HPHPH43_1004 [Helicobacter pylori Hp H-43]